MLLAIDTATRMAGIALYGPEGLRAEYTWYSNENHTVELMPYIVRACKQQALSPSGLTAVAVSLGPGSFTGVRVGLSVAKGLAMVCNIPILGIPTLDAAAQPHVGSAVPVCAVLPAGRSRWCVGFYHSGEEGWQRLGEYQLLGQDDLIDRLQGPTIVCGEVSRGLAKALRAGTPSEVTVPDAASAIRRPGYLAQLGYRRYQARERDDLASLAPVYLQHD